MLTPGSLLGQAAHMKLGLNAYLQVDGIVLPIEREITLLGRGLQNDLVFSEPTVSRSHARIVIQKRNSIIADRGSRHGTYVNGERVREKELHSGDIIALANFTLLYMEDTPRLERAEEEITRPMWP